VYASQVNLGGDDLGAYALLDLYPQRLSRMTFALHWDDMGPVYGSPYDRLARVPIVKAWVTPAELFSGDVIPMLRRMITPLKDRVRERNVQVLRERAAWKKDKSAQMAEQMRWQAQKSYDKPNAFAKKHLTKAEKSILDGTWREKVAERKPLEASPLGMI
jgi:hypothetical protein